MNFKKSISFFFTLLSILILFSTAEAQCAMCAATAEKSEYAKSLNQGILYLLFAPVFILGGVLLFWYKNRNKFKSEQ